MELENNDYYITGAFKTVDDAGKVIVYPIRAKVRACDKLSALMIVESEIEKILGSRRFTFSEQGLTVTQE